VKCLENISSFCSVLFSEKQNAVVVPVGISTYAIDIKAASLYIAKATVPEIIGTNKKSASNLYHNPSLGRPNRRRVRTNNIDAVHMLRDSLQTSFG